MKNSAGFMIGTIEFCYVHPTPGNGDYSIFFAVGRIRSDTVLLLPAFYNPASAIAIVSQYPQNWKIENECFFEWR